MSQNRVDILLVEDNPNDVRLTLHALEKYRLANNIVIKRDGADALAFIFATGAYADREVENTPGLILLDLRMPMVDGLEVLQRIKADSRTQHIPVIIMTSSAAERDRVASVLMGAVGYVIKPVDFEQFAEAVRQLGFYWLILDTPLNLVATDN
jgi:two-component system, response regulator